MSDDGLDRRLVFPVLVSLVEAEVIDLALRKMAAIAEGANEHEAWSIATGLAERFRKAAVAKEWT